MVAQYPNARQQANYLKHFRADSIVKDAELLRVHLLGEKGKWTLLGQSYGGFVAVHYLSMYQESLSGAIICGGLPPITKSNPDQIYADLYLKLQEYNNQYYGRYPEDAKKVISICDILSNRLEKEYPVLLPGGGILTPKRFLSLGTYFGYFGGFETVHYFIEKSLENSALLSPTSSSPASTFSPGAGAAGSGSASLAFASSEAVSIASAASSVLPSTFEEDFSFNFLREFESFFSFESNPIYAVLHESIYCQGESSNWSADRMRSEFPNFDSQRFFESRKVLRHVPSDVQMSTEKSIPAPANIAANTSASRLNFTSEMIYREMFDEYPQLNLLKDAAEILASFSGWSSLYDLDALENNSVPVAAVVYFDDLYVSRDLSLECAKHIRGIKLWITNEYYHSGLKDDGETILSKLIQLLS